MMDGRTLADAIRTRQASCVEVMTAYLDHIERLNPHVNAIVALEDRAALLAQARERDAQLARGDAIGPLHGFPHAVKDLAPVKGMRTTMGSPILQDFVAPADSVMVERLRTAGAIIIGKTNTPEFGLGSNTYNPVYGITRNAYDQSRSAGGSSGGAAVALALRMLPVAEEAQPDYSIDAVWRAWLKLRAWQAGGTLLPYYNDPAKRALLKPEAVFEVESGMKLSAFDVTAASAVRTEWYQAVRRFFEKYDFLIAPTAQTFAFDANLHWPTEIAGRYGRLCVIASRASTTEKTRAAIGISSPRRPCGYPPPSQRS